MSRTALPDFHTTIEDMIAEGDKVVQRFTARGTHKGEFMGIAPTGYECWDSSYYTLLTLLAYEFLISQYRLYYDS